MESKRNALQRAWRSGGVIDGDTIFVKFTFHGVIRVRMEIRCCFCYIMNFTNLFVLHLMIDIEISSSISVLIISRNQILFRDWVSYKNSINCSLFLFSTNFLGKHRVESCQECKRIDRPNFLEKHLRCYSIRNLTEKILKTKYLPFFLSSRSEIIGKLLQ